MSFEVVEGKHFPFLKNDLFIYLSAWVLVAVHGICHMGSSVLRHRLPSYGVQVQYLWYTGLVALRHGRS